MKLKLHSRTLLLVLAIIFGVISVSPRDFSYEYEGQTLIYTVINEEEKTCETKVGDSLIPGNNIIGELSIPAVASDGNLTYSVVKIGMYSFTKCESLNSIKLPSTIVSIDNYAFWGCSSLRSLVIQDGETELSLGHNGDNKYNSEKISLFSSCPLEYLYLGRNLVYHSGYKFDNSPFENKYKLKSIEIGSNVTIIGLSLFSGCSALVDVKFSEGLIALASRAFKNCYNLESIILPNSLIRIGENAFYGCSKLSSLVIPSSVETIGRAAFYGCSLSPLRFSRVYPDYTFLTDILNTSTIISSFSSAKSINRYFSGNVGYYDLPYIIKDIDPLIGGVNYNVEKNSFYEGDYNGISNFAVRCNTPWTKEDYIEIFPRIGENIFTKGLRADMSYNLTLKWNDATYGDDLEFEYDFETYRPEYNISTVSTQKTIKFADFVVYGDISTEITDYEITDWNYNHFAYNNDGIVFSDLVPDEKYKFYFGCKINGYDYDLPSQTYSTAPVGLNVDVLEVGPTSAKLFGKVEGGDIDIIRSWFQGYPDQSNDIVVLGLEPGAFCEFKYTVEVEGGKQFSKIVQFNTEDIEIKTLKPRVVSSTNAIVAASTNISDVETNVGFQWKKYDAPASLAPNEGYAAIYDGQLEGYIKNLQPTSYYNVRAFYKSANEKYYYSDWVTFDPSDFSYFEPTVHTYPVEPSTDGSVNVKGYVLAGTDDITEQGFEYWSAAGGAKAKRMLAEAPAGPVSKIFATGQVMTATLTDLAPSTTYTLRAFVTTVAGVTYGEEQTFTTSPDSSGIIGIDPDMSEPEVTGYYDLNGRRHEEPFSGLNIIRYSDGTVRKVFFK